MTRLNFYFGDVFEQGDVQKSVTKGWSREESSAANPITAFSGYYLPKRIVSPC